jgi:hypothetical protein
MTDVGGTKSNQKWFCREYKQKYLLREAVLWTWIRIQEGKNYPQNWQNIRVNKFYFLKHWMFGSRAEGFSCNLGILYGGLGISTLQFLTTNFFLQIYIFLIPGSESGFTWNTWSRSGSVSGFNESGSTALEEGDGILLSKAPVVAGEALLEGVLAPLRPRLVPVLVDNTEDDVCIDGNLVENANCQFYCISHEYQKMPHK